MFLEFNESFKIEKFVLFLGSAFAQGYKRMKRKSTFKSNGWMYINRFKFSSVATRQMMIELKKTITHQRLGNERG